MLSQLVSIAFLGTFSILLNCQKSDSDRPSFQEVTSVKSHTAEGQEAHPTPDSVLKNLRANFERLESNMDDDEIFRTLGLTRFRNSLQDNSRKVLDGAGGNWRYYIADQNGYSLAFRDFFGDVSCMLRLPGEEHWRTKRTNAKPIKLTDFDLNRLASHCHE